MRFLRDASIRIKVLIPPAIFVLALVVVSALAIYGMNQQYVALKEAHEIALKRIRVVDDFVVLSEQVQSDVFRISVLRFMNLPPEEIQPVTARLAQGLSDLNIVYGEILVRWTLDPTEREILGRMKPPLDEFRQQALQASVVVADDPALGVQLVRSSTVPFA
ncbi:MAG: hypothetical protein KKA73_11730, partial [Chloroflexi bacterium]|nr:hypothetical protein [Chloroflexota bacterium]